ncbi:MAG: NAD(P)-dependent oxidoreductase [Acidobacteriaceae bacterium]|nr:NAD(P)-dependent oxidoreductase [Acidobacteriaceae bacterium]
MRALVTGAQGCIGAWVAKLLLDRQIDTILYDIDPRSARLELIASPAQIRKARVVVGSVEDTAVLAALVRNEEITHIIHLAGVLIPFCQENPVQGALTNVIGTLNVFEAARRAGRAVRISYASSAAVWGPEEDYGDRSVSETDSLNPRTHYGVFKQANEGNARVYYSANGISSVGLRPWTVYGVGRDKGLTADPTIAAKAVVLRKPFQMRCTGYMDLQYVSDVANTFIECVLSRLEGAHVFNLSGDLIAIDEFIHILEALHPQAAGLISSGGAQVPVAYRMDASALHKDLPQLPKTTLKAGLEETLSIFERLHAEGRLSPDLA